MLWEKVVGVISVVRETVLWEKVFEEICEVTIPLFENRRVAYESYLHRYRSVVFVESIEERSVCKFVFLLSLSGGGNNMLMQSFHKCQRKSSFFPRRCRVLRVVLWIISFPHTP